LHADEAAQHRRDPLACLCVEPDVLLVGRGSGLPSEAWTRDRVRSQERGQDVM
jgi:hypothetical protein